VGRGQQITIENGRVVQSNFDSSPLMRPRRVLAHRGALRRHHLFADQSRRAGDSGAVQRFTTTGKRIRSPAIDTALLKA